jgi:hypothetical protein
MQVVEHLFSPRPCFKHGTGVLSLDGSGRDATVVNFVAVGILTAQQAAVGPTPLIPNVRWRCRKIFGELNTASPSSSSTAGSAIPLALREFHSILYDRRIRTAWWKSLETAGFGRC